MDPGSTSPDDETQSDAPSSAPGLIDNLAALWEDLRGGVHDRLQLAGLEARRALLGLVWIAVCGIVVGVLVVATWLSAAGALVFWLIEGGFDASAALLLGAVLNLLGVIAFAFMIRRKSQLLRFPATVRSFDPHSARAEQEPVRMERQP